MDNGKEILACVNKMQLAQQRLVDTVCGIPESSDDRGMVGDISDIKMELQKTRDRSIKNENTIKKIYKFVYGIILLIIGTIIRGEFSK